MFKQLFLATCCATTCSCSAMQPANQNTNHPALNPAALAAPITMTANDRLMHDCRTNLENLKTLLKDAENRAQNLVTGPNLRENSLRLIADRVYILTEAQKMHSKIGPISVALAREYTSIKNRAQRLISEE